MKAYDFELFGETLNVEALTSNRIEDIFPSLYRTRAIQIFVQSQGYYLHSLQEADFLREVRAYKALERECLQQLASSTSEGIHGILNI